MIVIASIKRASIPVFLKERHDENAKWLYFLAFKRCNMQILKRKYTCMEENMKRALFFTVAAAVFMLGGCTASQYTTLEEAVRAGEHLPSGVTIDDIDVSNMEIAEARRLINSNNEDRAKNTRFTVTLIDKTAYISADELHVRFDTDKVLLSAVNSGKASFFDTDERTFFTSMDASLGDIERGIGSVVTELRHEAKNAKVKLSSNGEFAFSADEVGYEADKSELAKLLKEKIALGQSADVEAPSKLVYPEYTIEQAREDTQLIAEFTTYFKGSTYGKAERVKNIVKAAGLLDASVVESGEIFSINQVLGDRNEENGWSIAAGIKDGAYVQEYGGGVCQVSTTLYNALLMADMRIVERHHHSWPLGYIDIGRDATISTGGPDLRFENTSGAALFIFCEADERKKQVSVKLYGRPLENGVSIKLSSEKVKTLEDLGTEMEEDASLAPGEQQVVRKARQGSVAVTYKTYYSSDGERLETVEVVRDTYHSIKGLIKVAPSAEATSTKSE